MNVLHINERDGTGGAAIAGYRLHRDLNGRGARSRMLVSRKLTRDDEVRIIHRSELWRSIDRRIGAAFDGASLPYVFYPSSFGLVRDPWFRQADIVHLHNAIGNYFSVTALPLLSRIKPVVWLIHDQWPLTGHVIYSHDCDRWRTGCGSCPYLDQYVPLRRDTSALLWRIKQAVYRASRLEIAAPSRWLAKQASESPLLGRFPVHHIPYGVDLDLFSPGSREEARRRLHLPLDRVIVLFVAELAEERKGFHLLEPALAGLSEPPLLVTLTSGARRMRVESRNLPPTFNERILADAYRAADMLVVPSQADNLPNVLLEALACGIPCVAFDAGGISDAVRDGETGLLVEPNDVEALASAIARLAANPDLRTRLGEAGRRIAVAEYGLALQSERYLGLYERLLEPNRSGRSTRRSC